MKDLEYIIKDSFALSNAYLLRREAMSLLEFVLIFPGDTSCKFQFPVHDGGEMSTAAVIKILESWLGPLGVDGWVDK